MIGKVVKIAVALALVHAGLRVSIVAARYYRFRDAAWQIVVRGGSTPTDRLGDAIFAEAIDLTVPVERAGIEVRRNRDLTTADVFYVESVPLLPNYTYPAELSLSVEARSMTPATLQDLGR
jgi:hypothetical protein